MNKIEFALKLAHECTYADEMTEGAKEHLRNEIEEALKQIKNDDALPNDVLPKVSGQKELVFAFVAEIRKEFPDQNWEYLDFIAERVIESNNNSVPETHNINGLRELTPKEVTESFLHQIKTLVDFYETETTKTTLRERLDGLALGILAAIDGESILLPSFILAPNPNITDKQYCLDNAQNWMPENNFANVNCNISGGLHDTYAKHYQSRNPETPPVLNSTITVATLLTEREGRSTKPVTKIYVDEFLCFKTGKSIYAVTVRYGRKNNECATFPHRFYDYKIAQQMCEELQQTKGTPYNKYAKDRLSGIISAKYAELASNKKTSETKEAETQESETEICESENTKSKNTQNENSKNE